MESTGERNRVQLSQDTVDLLSSAGKGHWCLPRKESVFAKGKGDLATFWLQKRAATAHSFDSSHNSDMASSVYDNSEADALHEVVDQQKVLERRQPAQVAQEKRVRLVDWNTDLLLAQIKEIVAARVGRDVPPDPFEEIRDLEMETLSGSGTVLAEVQDIIQLPCYVTSSKHVSGKSIELNEDVRSQLRDYVDTLCALYHENAFHNFEVRPSSGLEFGLYVKHFSFLTTMYSQQTQHASHVTMSVDK